MFAYVIRRLGISALVLAVSTLLMYVLVSNSGDPLQDLYTDQSPNKQAKIEARIDALDLDKPVLQRYSTWVQGVSGCVLPGAECDLGLTKSGRDVQPLLQQALTATLRLVLVAALLAALTGVGVGVLSAIRQYSAFDYGITFVSFLFFSLPIFWVAVMLKQYVAIGLNNWLRGPSFAPWVIALAALAAGTVAAVALTEQWRRRAVVFTAAAAVTAGVLAYLSSVEWFARPSLGPVFVGLAGLAAAAVGVVLFSDFARRRVVIAAFVMGAGALIAFFATGPVLTNPTWWHIAMLLGITTAVCVAAGWIIGGALDREAAIKASLFTGYCSGLAIFAHHVLAAFPSYSRKVAGRPVATIGSQTPGFNGNFWQVLLDQGLHVLLPTMALILITFAEFTRYTRSSMLEVLNQDYVRTARAKGLAERVVILRHAFRNALIPVSTLVAISFGALLGGAVITETVFGWRGMGRLFIDGLRDVDPNPVMAFYIVLAVAVMTANMIADVFYAYLDPRIRL
ncbi:MAG: ABC transporter permease [Micrococcales bacterium]|nr:MAG: ABC transporter permease [Micrococcales bacterium]PIE26131.1 MAG: ABC transporter permease [Micrococcales bacterium]